MSQSERDMMPTFLCAVGGSPNGESKGWKCDECSKHQARLATVEARSQRQLDTAHAANGELATALAEVEAERDVARRGLARMQALYEDAERDTNRAEARAQQAAADLIGVIAQRDKAWARVAQLESHIGLRVPEPKTMAEHIDADPTWELVADINLDEVGPDPLAFHTPTSLLEFAERGGKLDLPEVVEPACKLCYDSGVRTIPMGDGVAGHGPCTCGAKP